MFPSNTISSFDFDRFTSVVQHDSGPFLMVRPGFSFGFYVDAELSVTCAAIASLVEFLFRSFDPAPYSAYVGANGDIRPLTKRQVNKDLRVLRNLPVDYVGYILSYSDAPKGEASGYRIEVTAYTNPLSCIPDQSRLIRVEMPHDLLMLWGEERFMQFAEDVVRILPFNYAHAGFCFCRSLAERRAMATISPWLERYLGFDPSEHVVREVMRRRAYSAHWLSLLGPQLGEALGGTKTLRSSLPNAEIRDLPNCTWIRAARFPPIGDVNHGAPDIGCLPDVARVLKPLQPTNLQFAYTDHDAMRWIGRFDNYPSQPWENG